MLKALHVGNFKAFGDTQCIPIRPLTLIFGANSSGKSSIIHSLLLAIHATENGNLDVHQTKLGGEALDLGGFSQYIHKHDPDLKFQWGMDSIIGPVHPAVRFLGGFSRASVRFQVGPVSPENGASGVCAIPEVVTFELLLDDRIFVRLARQSNRRLHVVYVNFEHPILEDALEKLILKAATVGTGRELIVGEMVIGWDEKITEGERIEKIYSLKEETSRRAEDATRLLADRSQLKEFVRSDLAKVPFSVNRLFPAGMAPKGEENSYAYTYPQYDSQAILDSFDEGGGHWVSRVLRFEIEKLLEFVSDSSIDILSRVSYLGPLRCYPPRHSNGMNRHDPNWLSGGGVAWEALRRLPGVLEAVNEWLSAPDRLATRYRLRVRDLADLQQISPAIRSEIEKALVKVQLDPGASIPELVESTLKRVEELKAVRFASEIALRDCETNTELSHRDLGQGISQVLPVLVHAYGNQNQIIAIEQPELHLHPALQAELGDVFIESALGERKNTLILETHSEHLILRLMRRMRETHRKTLPEGLPPVYPKDVAILFVEKDGSRSIVREMPLNEMGQLVKAWPGGFFEEGFRELFS